MPSPQSAAEDTVRSARVVLFAYHEMGYGCMAALLKMGAPVAAMFTHRDSPGEQIWWHSCAELARRHSVPVHTPEKIGPDEIALTAALRPDVIYSFYYRNLLPPALLSLAPRGAYNMHGSMLPRYRGRAPVNWMIINGEKEAGVTLHHMVERADAGDIVAQRAAPIEDRDTALTLYRKLVPLGVELITEFHPRIVMGDAPRRPNDLSRGSYFGRRRPEDGRIDFKWSARRVFNLVRALTHPYPGAFCDLGGRRLWVWEARVGAEAGRCGRPGTVIHAHDGGALEVACGEGTIILCRVQLEGGAEAPARTITGAGGAPELR